MVSLPIYDRTGKEVGRYDIDPQQIAPKISKQLLHDAVVMYLANRRQGTAKTKPRNEVAGSTRKLYKQKGTGNARVGSIRAPHRRGGGHAKSIKPRSYYYRLPKKAVRAATRMAIASKLADGQVVVIDQLSMDAPKTKDFAAILKALGLSAMTTVVATAEHNANVYRSGRNIPGVTITPVADLNALVVLQPKRMLVTKAALDWLKSQSA
ncbi:MAG: 50S ribosomal protein L4 [Planctomycetaceae bacterium]|nr:50S ribosomal protein L4 [Planctomycetaceae bacterium]MBN8604903.1 50S ribosomal protein L4 [Planctomycetota bacterium]